MKALVVTRRWSFHGGVETATAGLLEALVAHGHEVEVLSAGAQRGERGIRVHRLPAPPLPPAARLIATAALARVVIARGRWDIVQAHDRVLGADVYRAGEGCHRAYLAAVGQPRRRRLYHRVVLALERRVFARTPGIVAIARRGVEEIATLYAVPRARLHLVWNGVDLARFHPDRRVRDRDRARDDAGVDSRTAVALFVGSGFERKGLATAIRAFAALGGRGRRLLVVGRGDERPYRALASTLGVSDGLVWLGPRADIERWYAAADVLLLPARYEPFGNVHLEALASGLPVVTSTRAGGAEVVDEGVNGAVREPDDALGVAEAVRKLEACSGADLVAACRRAAEPFTYARQVAALEAIWKGECIATRDRA